jgi:hypothetical protein
MRRLAALLLLAAASGRAGELQTDGAVDFRIGLGRRWDVLVHNRARVRATQNDWYDVSLIPIFRYQWRRNVQLGAGAFFSWFEYPNNNWQRHVRPVFYLEPSFRWSQATFALRTQYERFLITNRPDCNRYRQRFRVSNGRTWAPYGSIEFFFTNHGYATTRYGAGVRRNLGKRNAIEWGYWYETRRLHDYGMRHMIHTTFTINFQGFAPDL